VHDASYFGFKVWHFINGNQTSKVGNKEQVAYFLYGPEQLPYVVTHLFLHQNFVLHVAEVDRNQRRHR